MGVEKEFNSYKEQPTMTRRKFLRLLREGFLVIGLGSTGLGFVEAGHAAQYKLDFRGLEEEWVRRLTLEQKQELLLAKQEKIEGIIKQYEQDRQKFINLKSNGLYDQWQEGTSSGVLKLFAGFWSMMAGMGLWFFEPKNSKNL